MLTQIKDVTWEVFSKHNTKGKEVDNVRIQPVNKEMFTTSLLGAEGVLCNAGFETPAETLYLGKKLCVIPMIGQYEQQCNAAMLKHMGVQVLSRFDGSALDEIKTWTMSNNRVTVNYPNNVEQVVEELIYNRMTNVEQLPALSIGRLYF